ncbi:hypothetical protein [Streptomyces sp. NBC_01481]|uniref:hypothetical protein n=1 Tax=Streptomyces sp. NBC_01481 TaxID=2975869 RepID=UPI0022577FA7|nr:hypothetical protein [Streptomyces sp. NBC_01481]MCX4583234.1 hypothetical protein [Streptomyces sp. NBC_01481]
MRRPWRVSRGDYCLDMRNAPPVARDWLNVVRQTRTIGNAWPVDTEPVRPAATHDVLIHLHRVRAADRL